jgi:hypothetical protein
MRDHRAIGTTELGGAVSDEAASPLRGDDAVDQIVEECRNHRAYRHRLVQRQTEKRHDSFVAVAIDGFEQQRVLTAECGVETRARPAGRCIEIIP